ncbi:hypothetical protein O3P69_010521, partial [Scylla paramamosain]
VVESDDEAASDGDEEDDEAGEGDEGTTQKGKKKKQRKKGKQKKKSSNGVEKEEEDEPKKEISTEESRKKEESIWAVQAFTLAFTLRSRSDHGPVTVPSKDILTGTRPTRERNLIASVNVAHGPAPILFHSSRVQAQPSPKNPRPPAGGALLGNKKPTTTTDTTPAKAPAPAKKENKEGSSKPEKVKITQVFEFAGEESPGTTKAQSGVGGIKRGAGLSGLVSLLDSKKQKLTTLEKTKLDWNSFKSEEGIDEELEKHKKSKDGYLDKQAFLERADLRQFEIERAMRMSKRSNR